MNFTVPAEYKLKDSDKYLDPTRELRKLWNMKVTLISIVKILNTYKT